MHPILLASSSVYRQELMARLQLSFSHYAPDIDETARLGESIPELVIRLSKEKAQAASCVYPDQICIGADEVATLEGCLLGKPGDHVTATAQLTQMSGKKVHFYTGICVYAPFLDHEETHLATCAVVFQTLSPQMIENYLIKEKPYGSAGSFKSESLGSALIERFEGEDPTAIIGLPLIALCKMLRKVGITVV